MSGYLESLKTIVEAKDYHAGLDEYFSYLAAPKLLWKNYFGERRVAVPGSL
ncbi:hypothetical protein LEP1GSC088_2902 [Leptospira interrogans str. L1207]|nr:hypothetical protein LEP1GSC088_2902 [Leptospira interrogans str. L1207]